MDIARQYGVSRQRIWQLVNPIKQRAHDKAWDARLSGRLVPPRQCEHCGKRRLVQSHHPDHTKPLVVEWLCVWCHRAADRKLRAPRVAAHRAAKRLAKKEQRRVAQVERQLRRKAFYRKRWQKALPILQSMSKRDIGPTYSELASRLWGRSIPNRMGCAMIALYLGRMSNSRVPYWWRVQALYRLARVKRHRPGQSRRVA